MRDRRVMYAGDRCCTSLYVGSRSERIWVQDWARRVANKFNTRYMCAECTSMYATWAFQFYEALVWALAERFEQ